MVFFGKISNMGPDSLLRKITFDGDGVMSKDWHPRRRVGRPRLQWTTCVYALAYDIAGDPAALADMLQNIGGGRWRNAVKKYFRGS